MDFQVLIATTNQTDHSLLKKMNINSDAIVGNQCDRNEIEEFEYNNHKIKYLSFNERGVGLNRNNALMRATADICVLADDDVVFFDDYEEIIKEQFQVNPKVDVIIFNIVEEIPIRYIIKKMHRIRYWNFMKYGAVRIAFRRERVTRRGISFNLHFGGGSEYSAGEDTLFLSDCLKKGLKILAVPVFISHLTNIRNSTWNEGYTSKYFMDKGALYAAVSERWASLLCLQFSIRKRRKYADCFSWLSALQLMLCGAKEYIHE